jgi:flagellar biosynthesis protein FliR
MKIDGIHYRHNGRRLELFFLVLVRVSMIFLITPIFGRRNLPIAVKGGARICTERNNGKHR